MHETDKDPRLLVAELAHKKLTANIYVKAGMETIHKEGEVTTIVQKIEGHIKSLKYSYMEPVDIPNSDMVKAIVKGATHIYTNHKAAFEHMPDMPKSTNIWALNILGGLPRRFSNSGKKISNGVDIFAVRIRSINQIGKLWMTRCDAGSRGFTIVTNIHGLAITDTLRAAMLPPATVGGKVSEMMFLGDEKIDLEPGSVINSDEIDTKEADGILFNEVGKYK